MIFSLKKFTGNQKSLLNLKLIEIQLSVMTVELKKINTRRNRRNYVGYGGLSDMAVSDEPDENTWGRSGV